MSKGAHGVVAKVIGWGAPTQGSILGYCTICGKIKQNHLTGLMCQSAGQETTPSWHEDRVWPKQESHGLRFPVSGRAGAWGFLFACMRKPSSYMQCPGVACPSQADFFLFSVITV
jgi:hypothetical protein